MRGKPPMARAEPAAMLDLRNCLRFISYSAISESSHVVELRRREQCPEQIPDGGGFGDGPQLKAGLVPVHLAAVLVVADADDLVSGFEADVPGFHLEAHPLAGL